MLSWKPLEDGAQLNQIVESSKSAPVAIYKHSTSCPVSAAVLHRLERLWDIPDSAITMYFLDLLKYRTLSNEVASLFDLPHASPQLLIVENGKLKAGTSHRQITIDFVKKALGFC